MQETKSDRIDRLVEDVVAICKATLPTLANKPENEKSLDDMGLEFLMSGIVFIYDGNTPDAEQFQQLKEIAATSAETYRSIRTKMVDENVEPEEESLMNLCLTFLQLWRRNVDFSEGKSKH